MDRAEAIRVLEAKGFYAKQRSWALGENTILIAALPNDGPIRSYRVALYLYPEPDDDTVWWITDFRVPGTDTKCGSLEAAVRIGAERVISEVRRLESKPG